MRRLDEIDAEVKKLREQFHADSTTVREREKIVERCFALLNEKRDITVQDRFDERFGPTRLIPDVPVLKGRN